MHELSIAMGIVRIAENELAKADAKKVTKIELEIGDLYGDELDSLNYVWELSIKDRVRMSACCAVAKKGLSKGGGQGRVGFAH